MLELSESQNTGKTLNKWLQRQMNRLKRKLKQQILATIWMSFFKLPTNRVVELGSQVEI